MRSAFFSFWLAGAALMAGCSFETGRFVIGDAGQGAVDAPITPQDQLAPDTPAVNDTPPPTDVVDAGGAVDLPRVEEAGADVLLDDVPYDAPDVRVAIFCSQGTPCPTGLVCDDGVCEAGCPSGQMSCGGYCRMIASDVANCGACDRACAAGQECRNGTCSTVCVAPATSCSDVCRDLQTDDNHCGMCDRACTGGAACVSGACACPSGQTLCGSACTNLMTDFNNCGRCGGACGAGQVCASGSCVVNCTAGLTNCTGTCRDLQTDLSACGRCGNACAAPTGGTAGCSGGACVQLCPRGRANCAGACVDLETSSSHCGSCGRVCDTRLSVCSAGVCCLRGTTNCGGRCTSLSSDNANCGACGRACGTGTWCRAGSCEPNFRIASITATSPIVIDHANVVGDDRGGIAANATYVYYSGDLATGRASASNVSGLTAVVMPPIDGLFSNLRDGRIYTLSNDGSTPFRNNFATTTFTHIIELSPTNLAATTNRIALTPPIAFANPGGWGVFAGYDRLVLHNGARAYNISLPSGATSDLGAVPLTSPNRCESWAYWGVAEYHGSAIWLVYRQTPTSGTATAIVRTRVPDGLTQTVGAFTNLSDLCSFTVIPSRGRWFWHLEGTAQFTGTTFSEWMGTAAATFAYVN